MTFSQDITALLPNAKCLDARYLVRFLEAQRPHFERLARGATIKGITRQVVEDLKVPDLTIKEQRRIAAILDQAEALRAKRREALAKLDTLTQSLFLEMFGDPLSRTSKYAKVPLDAIIQFTGGSQPPKSVFRDGPAEGFVRLVQIRDFRTSKFPTYIPIALSRRLFNTDDVMIGRYGPPVFQIFRGLAGSYNVALLKATPKEGLTKTFLYHLLRFPSVQNLVVETPSVPPVSLVST